MKEAAEFFKLLSVDKRIDIIELLKKEDMSVNAIAEVLGITQSAVSQHLRVLKSAGLVKDERRGYYIFYALNREALEECRKRLNRICTCGCTGTQTHGTQACSSEQATQGEQASGGEQAPVKKPCGCSGKKD